MCSAHRLTERNFLNLMEIEHRAQEIWSGQESITEGMTDRQTEGIPIAPNLLCGGGLNFLACSHFLHVSLKLHSL